MGNSTNPKATSSHQLKILFVTDVPGSALSTVARARAKLIDADVIYSSDFMNPTALIDYIQSQGYTGVLFNWRGALKEGLKLESFCEKYSEVARKSYIHCLVPDFLGLDSRFLLEESKLLNSVHGYWVTCDKLQIEYSNLFPHTPPNGILHDLPDTDLISRISSASKRQQVIWVGNSAWGRRFGFVDHKGLKRFVEPLIQRFHENKSTVSFKILDSRKSRVLNIHVLEEINRSRVLLQTSDSEGTGIPILEALGLSVVPVTTDVGIAPEVLTGELSGFIVDRSLNSFERAINDAFAFVDIQLLRDRYSEYIRIAESEEIVWGKKHISISKSATNKVEEYRIRAIWFYRFFRSRGWKRG